MKKLLIILLFVLCLVPTVTSITGEAYYTMDDADVSGVNVTDSTGNGHNGTIHNGALTGQPGKINQSIWFDGSNDYIALYTDKNSTFSACAWVKLDATATQDRILSNDLDPFNGWGFMFDDDNKLRLYTNAKDCKDDLALNNEEWYHVCVTVDDLTGTGDIELYINGSSAKSCVGKTGNGNFGALTIAAGTVAANFYDGNIDELIYAPGQIYNLTQIQELWNNHTGYNPYGYPEPVGDSGSVSVIIRNSTNDITTDLYAGVDFFTFGNWTNSSNSPINDSIGYCNATFESGIIETESVDDNLTICSNALCDHVNTYSENFTGTDTTNLEHYDIQAYLCYPATQGSEVISLNVTCGSDGFSHNLSPAEIPICSNDRLFFLGEGDGSCNTSSNITINVNSDDDYADRLQVTDLGVDAVYSSLMNSMSYNSSSGLWYLNHTHEYYDTGSYLIEIDCIDTNSSLLNASGNTTVNVSGFVPDAFFNSVVTDCDTTLYVDSTTTIEYCAGNWSFFGSVVGLGLDMLNLSWYNNTGDLIFNLTDVDYELPAVAQTPSGLFRDFDESPFIIGLWINNTFGELYKNFTFRINDTISPTVTINLPLNNTNLFGSNFINVSGVCGDQALYKMNVTVFQINDSSVFWTFENTSITETSQTVTNSSVNITGLTPSVNSSHVVLATNISCSDGHTNTDINDYSVDQLKNNALRFEDEINIEVPGIDHLSTVKDGDRYIFNIEDKFAKSEIIYRIYTDYKVEYVPQYGYCGHIIIDRPHCDGSYCNDWWFDTEGEGVTDCVFSEEEGYYQIITYLDSPVKELVTHSLGELNTWSVQQEYINYDTSLLTVEFDGVVCGEKYPDNSHTVDLSTDTLTNCTVRVNDAYITFMNGSCTSINITTNIGWNTINVVGYNSLSEQIESECNIWTDKQDKEVSDFMWIILLIAVIVACLLMSKVYSFFFLAAGILIVVLGFYFFAFSWVVASIVILIGIIIALLPLLDGVRLGGL